MAFLGLTDLVYRITLQCARFFYANMLWIFFTIAGLGIFGLFPATRALVSLVHIWDEDRSAPIFKTFYKEFRESFLQANATGWMLTPLAALPAYGIYLAQNWANPASVYVMFMLVGLFLFVLSYAWFVFPVQFLTGEKRLAASWKNTLFISITSPHIFLGMVFAFLAVLAVLVFTGFFIFFFASVSVWIMMKGTKFAMRHIQKRQDHSMPALT
ncbi:YesL family protein [Alkalicoccus halolimnae]|uniref:DUF624 domain-containing protein n=1 Tax=Alkalicoccus halolimnae TaxID=1667239 RepID=A0A5C7F7K7_9BACI|nr:DUF624 domain-containing protein [Alkalicoccus halolimnae]TXF85560.1 DUF624 domain-containing protein [Alkalicoccus halolimnae]